MDHTQRKIIAREKWVKTYLELGSVTKAAIRGGISRPTLYRWIKRYKIDKIVGLSDKSQRPKNLTNSKVDDDLESIILKTRKKFNWGPQRISNYLLRTRRIQLSPMTIWRVISRNQCPPVLKKRKKSDFKRYSKSIPGERVQIDVTKIRSKAYQFTAIDDCTRLKLIRIVSQR